MKVSTISDIHVTTTKSEQYKILLDFLNHEKVHDSDRILLLGDIFDYLTGEHEEYIEKYSEFFKLIASHLEDGKTIYYLEGNHDFHFKNTFIKALDSLVEDKAKLQNFKYSRNSVELRIGERNYLFCHGDDLDFNNKAYRRWKSIYSSKAFGFFISKVLPFKFVESLGEKASSDSKRRGRSTFNYDREKAKYRQAAKEYLKGRGIDILIAGHTHISDKYEWEGKTYLNIGFPLKDKEFLFIEERVSQRISIK